MASKKTALCVACDAIGKAVYCVDNAAKFIPIDILIGYVSVNGCVPS
jgi:hypothetical protein